MARLILFFCATCLVAACGAPQKDASRLYAKGVKYYYFDSHDESQAFFQKSVDSGYVLPGAYGSLGITLIKQGHVEEGITLLDKEYELYHDPLVKDYLAFIRKRFELDDPAPMTPAAPSENPTPVVPDTADTATPAQPAAEPAPATGGVQ